MNSKDVVKFLSEANTQTLIQIAKELAKSNTDVANDLEFMLSFAIHDELRQKDNV